MKAGQGAWRAWPRSCSEITRATCGNERALDAVAEPGEPVRRHRRDTAEGHIHRQPRDHPRSGDPDTIEEALSGQSLAHMPLRIQGKAARGDGGPKLDRAVFP